MTNVVGYTRVSTRRQAELGGSLDEQAYVVRGFCDEKKLNLLTIEEDDCSAAGARGHLFRPGLRQAIRTAKEKGASLLVPSVDRLARHPAVLSEIFESGLPVISIRERRRVGRQTLKRLIHDAQRERDQIARISRESLARAKKRGVKLGNRKNLSVAQRDGAVSNAARADRKVQELTDFIERTPGWDKMTLRDKVEIVNRSGPLNLISEKRGERRQWTLSSIRKPLKKAEAELEIRKELDAEPMDIAFEQDWGSAAEEADTMIEDTAAVSQVDDELPDHAYEDHPDFGRF